MVQPGEEAIREVLTHKGLLDQRLSNELAQVCKTARVNAAMMLNTFLSTLSCQYTRNDVLPVSSLVWWIQQACHALVLTSRNLCCRASGIGLTKGNFAKLCCIMTTPSLQHLTWKISTRLARLRALTTGQVHAHLMHALATCCSCQKCQGQQ